MSHHIREAVTADYETISAVHNATHPETVTRSTPDRLAHFDRVLGEKYKFKRYVIEVEGRIVGSATSSHMIVFFHPQKFYVLGVVHPDYQNRGLGAALYDHVMAGIAKYDPIAIWSRCREDVASGIRFLERRGFTAENREWESCLTLATFDAAKLSDELKRVEADGIVIQRFNEVQDRPGWDRKLYDLIIHVQRDMPMTDIYQPMAFEEFKRVMWDAPQFYPGGYFIASHEGRFVGVSILEKDLADPEQLHTDDTGVHRDYRRKGIATALKLRAIMHAKDAGFKSIRTFNDATNRAMLSINERLGYEKFPAWVGFIRNTATGAQ